MKALLQHAYGTPDVLEIAEIETPTAGEGEVLVRVRAASINAGDWFIMTGKPYIARLAFGISVPKSKVRGRDVSGTVEAIGTGVTGYAIGDAVFGESESGSLAEFAVVGQKTLALAPTRITLDQAAAAPVAGATAVQALTEAVTIGPGTRVLVNGASGGVGTFAVQIAVSLGADVTAVCSARNAVQAADLGAQTVVDYAVADVTEGEERYDVILDMVGNHSLRRLRRILVPGGTLVLSSGAGSALLGPIGRLLRGAVYNLVVRERVTSFVGSSTTARLDRLAGFIDSGQVTPRIEATFPLAQGADAMRRFGQEHARSKIVIAVSK